jgi:hypothetical protein
MINRISKTENTSQKRKETKRQWTLNTTEITKDW